MTKITRKFVSTEYVPNDTYYLTPNREYEVLSDILERAYFILDDSGAGLYINPKGCPHLDYRKWDVTEVTLNE